MAWADVASGEYEKAFEVRLVAVSATSGAKLVYTLDGSNPTASSPQVENGTKITISGSCTLKVGLLKNGAVSSVLSRDYQIVPFTPHTATVHVKDPSWPSVYFYMWDKKGDELNGTWPGSVVTDTKMVKGAKFYYKTVNVPSKDYYFNVIFDKGSNEEQTVDIGPIRNDVYYEIRGSINGKMLVDDVTLQYTGGGDTPIKGDIDGNGELNVSDVTTLVNIILGTHEDPNQKLTGADISLLDRYEQRGAIYYDKNGTKVTDMLAFYKQIGLNAMRVRLFVDPSKASDADKGQGVFQDIAYVKALGKRIKDHGLKFILDFHYSDSWADPGKQTVPSQ